ncbi:amino-acid N-acetyltransferase [Oleispira antarctica]|uniref:Amino-acid acetyltransferase n=1 Tax=Oleispira antarctica TaxID=188908 RepID=A0A1Y5HRD8_OLEAN|nr:amino-acid N-acetyltransferase [Oleispira antarctica]
MDNSQYVKWFRHSSPYINAHRGKTFVLMLEGDAIADDNFAHIVQDIALLNSLGVRLVIVHGARPQIDQALNVLNIKSQFHGELRITDQAALNAVRAAIGIVKSDIEARLSIGLPNTPMHGARIRVVSGNFVTAKPKGVIDGIDFQHTGEVRRIDRRAIGQQLDQGNIVLLSSCGYSPSGEMFNLAAEDVATQAAISLDAEKLILMGEDEGLPSIEMANEKTADKDNSGIISQITTDELSKLIETLSGEHKVHAQSSLTAVKAGINRAHLLSHKVDGALLQELFTHEGAGTLITAGDYEQLRQANIEDVGGILELLTPLEDQGVLVRRSREVLETEISRFKVIERDGMVIACAALYPHSNELAELACVAVSSEYRSGQRGDRLLNAISEQAKAEKIDQIFVLTTRTAHWFIERGFSEADISALPKERQSLYNFQRNSKIFIKQLN